jgi:hypothetical protein
MAHIYDLRHEDGPKLLEVDEAVAREMIELHGDRYSRANTTGRLVVFDLEFDSRGAAAVQMHETDAMSAHSRFPQRYVFELPRAARHSDRLGQHRVKLA